MVNKDVEILEKNIQNMEKDLQEIKEKLEVIKLQKKSNDWGLNNSDDVIGYGIKSDDEIYSIHHNWMNVFEKDQRISKIFKTKEKAEEIAFKQQLWRKLQRIADENTDNVGQYVLKYLETTKIIEVHQYIGGSIFFGEIIFPSKKSANKAIEMYEDELLKYFTM